MQRKKQKEKLTTTGKATAPKKKSKYIIVVGSVISGVGKGTFTASLANLLKLAHGLKVSPLKFDGYLNYDAGTLNPYRHGEVFVLDDGTECDLDLGSYERMINQNLTHHNYLTAGKLFKTIIDKERRGEYLGRDVQFIPHVTNEIKNYVKKLGKISGADVVLVEVGGTIGDLENSYFIEAMRELAYEEGRENICFINVVYILEPRSLGEQKTKAAQLGTRRLMELGIQPDMIVCRSENPISEHVKEKMSIYSNVPIDRIISLPDHDVIYEIPLLLAEKKVDEKVCDILKLRFKEKPSVDFKRWEELAKKMRKSTKTIEIAITGKYTDVHDAYISILSALEHTAPYLNAKVNVRWIETTKIERDKKVEERLKGVNGIIVPGGFGFRGAEGKIMCINYARENNIPFLGLCFGFQLACIEYARNVCGLKNANSTEIDPNTKTPVIIILPEKEGLKEMGGTLRLGGQDVEIKPGTEAHKIYRKTLVRERFRHRYELNPEYIEVLERNGLVFSGKAPKREIMQILELPDHPFFMATQFHPEYTSKPLSPSPIFKAFLEAALGLDKNC
jgi:CTP synthase